MSTILQDLATTLENCQLENLAKQATIIATNDTNSNAYNLIDGNSNTYWTSYGCDAINSYIELNFNNKKEFNTIEIKEYVPHGTNVEEFKIYAYGENGWFQLHGGSTIGDKYSANFPTIQTSRLKVSFLKYTNDITINEIGVYMQ